MATTNKDNLKTLVIDKFNGRLTRFRDGDINSGMANFYSSWGFDTFQRSGTLAFLEAPVSIKGSVITDLVMAGKVRVESTITYLYCIGHTGRLYKIQINDPTGHNPDKDTPVLLTTLANSQTFKYGASLEFFKPSSTEYIYIGHDTGITQINFDGTGETNTTSSFTANVPRQTVQFLGNLLITDGANLAKVDSTNTITHTILSPGFPANTQARDIRVTADGRYIVVVVARNPLGDMTLVFPNVSDIASIPSTLVYWNGTDQAASSFTSFPSFTMTSYSTFASYEYFFGYQIGGAMLGSTGSNGTKTILVDEFANPPLPNTIGASGDFLGWGTTVFNALTGHTQALLSIYGTIDAETPVGQYRQYIMSSSLTGGDVVRIPFYTPVTSFATAGSTSGYTTAPFQLFGTGKSYFSTLEYDGTNTKYDFYLFKNASDFLNNAGAGVYETQHQVFSKKIKPSEVRIYYEPTSTPTLVSFKIDLIGIDGTVLSGGTYTFTNSNQITSTSNLGQFQPTVGATPALGVRITNAGTVTPLIHRVEVDYTPYGS